MCHYWDMEINTKETQVIWLINIEHSDGSFSQSEFTTYEAAKAYYTEMFARWDVVEVSEPEGVRI